MQKFTRTEHERYSELKFPALNQNAAITNLQAMPELNPERDVPKPNVMIRAVVAYVDLCVDAIAALNDAVAKAAVNKNLSMEGRATAVAPQKAAAINTLESALKFGRDDAAEVAAAREALYTPPALAADDVRGELVDQEIRRRYHAMQLGPRGDMLAAQSPESTRGILAALLRDPIDSSIKAWAAQMWKASVTTLRPDEAATVEMQEGVIAWMWQSLRTLSAILDASTDYQSIREARKRGLVIEPPAGDAATGAAQTAATIQ